MLFNLMLILCGATCNKLGGLHKAPNITAMTRVSLSEGPYSSESSIGIQFILSFLSCHGSNDAVSLFKQHPSMVIKYKASLPIISNKVR